MSVPATKEEARQRVAALVELYRRNAAEYSRPGSTYGETQARTDFISPLLEALGWDVHNIAGLPLDLREVFEEATVEVGDERLSKKPDYELRLARQRKLFVEAKKPSAALGKRPAFQTRRYGFSASLPISVLVNFDQLVIYDCLPVPSEEDEPHVARLAVFGFEEFVTRFDELYDKLSRNAVYTGRFDELFHVDVARQGTEQFDSHFLGQVRSWRERLAQDIYRNNPRLSPSELSFAVQLFLSRIVFLRICEDREIEKYESLKELSDGAPFAELMRLLERADRFYDSGIFRLLDDQRLGIRISDDVLASIIGELYYPQSPYTFSVVEASVLGEVYEQFLGEVIIINAAGEAEVVLKPEVRESGGVVPTPKFVVDDILGRALDAALEGKRPEDLAAFTVADICCGSGVFLLGAYDRLLAYHLNSYVANDSSVHAGTRIFRGPGDQWRLTFEEKRRILLQSIRGVDIDPNAVEVARFSLLLRLLEDETSEALKEYERRRREPVLPDLAPFIRSGNSLVSHEEFAAHSPAASPELVEKVSPFSWGREFPAEIARGGFDVVVGNPPYIRIQNMVHYSPEEVEFYNAAGSPYTTARSDNFDKYTLFVERSLKLLCPHGWLGVIVPHKFMTLTSGRALRRLLTRGRHVAELVYFGAQQVFGAAAANYTCILVAKKRGSDTVQVEKVVNVKRWRYGEPGERNAVAAAVLTEEPWELVAGSAMAVFDRVRAACPERLGDVADIFVGIQTSADDVYIVEATREEPDRIFFEWDGREWTAEREVLRPFLHDMPIEAYSRPVANTYVIFPYRIIGSRAKLIQPDEMTGSFPGVMAYLTTRRTELEGRSISGGRAGEQQFYQYGRSQSLTKFDSPKLIVRVLSLEPRHAYDDRNTVVSGGGNGPYYVVRPKPGAAHSLFYLLAVLCHPLSEAMVRTRTSVFRGGYYSHGKQFIEVLPVPPATPELRAEIETLVQRLIATKTEAAAARVPAARAAKEREAAALRARVEGAVSRAFGLSDSELETVREVPVPS